MLAGESVRHGPGPGPSEAVDVRAKPAPRTATGPVQLGMSGLTSSMVLALQRGAGNAAVSRTLGSDRGVIQRKLVGELKDLSATGFKSRLEAAGWKGTFKDARELFEKAQASTKDFRTIAEVIAEFEKTTSTAPAQAPSKTVGAGRIPAATLTKIATLSDEAQAEAVSAVKEVKKTSRRAEQTEAKKHKTVGQGGEKMIIHNVWLGNGQLGALEKFNLYSWRALGHEVHIYTHAFAGHPQPNAESLGLEAGDAQLHKLLDEVLVEDEVEAKADTEAKKDTAKASLGDARSILAKWLKQGSARVIPTDQKAKDKEQEEFKPALYNMIDLAKSYLGGTRQGIVLDTKVGTKCAPPRLCRKLQHATDQLHPRRKYTRAARKPEHRDDAA